MIVRRTSPGQVSNIFATASLHGLDSLGKPQSVIIQAEPLLWKQKNPNVSVKQQAHDRDSYLIFNSENIGSFLSKSLFFSPCDSQNATVQTAK